MFCPPRNTASPSIMLMMNTYLSRTRGKPSVSRWKGHCPHGRGAQLNWIESALHYLAYCWVIFRRLYVGSMYSEKPRTTVLAKAHWSHDHGPPLDPAAVFSESSNNEPLQCLPLVHEVVQHVGIYPFSLFWTTMIVFLCSTPSTRLLRIEPNNPSFTALSTE